MEPDNADEILPEYDFSNAGRGKHADRIARDAVMVVLDADVAREFPTSESVNDALRLLLAIKKQLVGAA